MASKRINPYRTILNVYIVDAVNITSEKSSESNLSPEESTI